MRVSKLFRNFDLCPQEHEVMRARNFLFISSHIVKPDHVAKFGQDRLWTVGEPPLLVNIESQFSTFHSPCDILLR